jgi:hypothetical protein
LLTQLEQSGLTSIAEAVGLDAKIQNSKIWIV